MFVVVAIAVLFVAFVAYRVIRRDPVPEADQEPYQPITAQAPHTAELAPQSTGETSPSS